MTNPSTNLTKLQKQQPQIDHKSIINLQKSYKGQSESIREKGPLQDPPNLWCTDVLNLFDATWSISETHLGAHWISKGTPNRQFSYKINIQAKNCVQEGVLESMIFGLI